MWALQEKDLECFSSREPQCLANRWPVVYRQKNTYLLHKYTRTSLWIQHMLNSPNSRLLPTEALLNGFGLWVPRSKNTQIRSIIMAEWLRLKLLHLTVICTFRIELRRAKDRCKRCERHTLNLRTISFLFAHFIFYFFNNPYVAQM